MNRNNMESIGCFKVVLDAYNGITIGSKYLPEFKREFELNLDKLIEEVGDGRNLIWIYINIEKSDFIPVAVKRGFVFHTCEADYVLLVKRLKQNAIVPTAANYTLGIGAVIINKNNELLVVKNRHLPIGYILPGGHIETSELLSEALQREIKEETGIKVEFENIVSLGHFYPHQFNKSNLYIVCKAKPLSNHITIQDTQEIEDAKWIDVDEYLGHEHVAKYSKTLVKSALTSRGLTKDNQDILSHINKQFELFFP